MRLSDYIENMILEQLQAEGGSTELRRNELAQQLGCVPSQVTYVLSSRFTPARGYQVESYRGGGGYVRVTRIALDRNSYLMHCFHAVGERIDRASASAILSNLRDNDILTEREAALLGGCLSDGALGAVEPAGREYVRADLLRQIIMQLV